MVCIKRTVRMRVGGLPIKTEDLQIGFEIFQKRGRPLVVDIAINKLHCKQNEAVDLTGRNNIMVYKSVNNNNQRHWKYWCHFMENNSYPLNTMRWIYKHYTKPLFWVRLCAPMRCSRMRKIIKVTNRMNVKGEKQVSFIWIRYPKNANGESERPVGVSYTLSAPTRVCER